MNKETRIIRDIMNNTKEIYMSDSSLATLLDFERVIDSLDLYAYQNWQVGELVKGPVIEKYFVTCEFMWPYKKMPDPRGAERLLEYGCEVTFEKTKLKYPKEIETQMDYEDGTKVAKMEEVTVWIISIVMPKGLMNDIYQGSMEKESELVDLDDLEDAYEAGIEDDMNQDNDDEEVLATQDEEVADEVN